MAYTYTEPTGGVFSDAVSEVRYYLGDTTPAAPFSLSDAEIQFELAQSSNNRKLAAANAAYKMAVRYGSEATTSKSVGNLSLTRSYASLRDQYAALATQLRTGADTGATGGPAFTGGDGTPQFTVGQFDYEE